MTIILTKLDSARRQTTTAIDLFFTDGDPVSIHTLIMSANEITTTICKKLSIGNCFLNVIKSIPNENFVKEFIGHFNMARNFFKHANTDAEKIIPFNPNFNMPIIYDTTIGYQLISGEITHKFAAYNAWFMVTHFEHFKNQGPSEFFERFESPTKFYRDYLHNNSKLSFYKDFMSDAASLETNNLQHVNTLQEQVLQYK